MTRTRVRFSCAECGAQAPKWLGRCPECGGWDTLAEESVPGTGSSASSGSGPTDRPIPLGDVDTGVAAMRPTGIEELDRVLGGGLVGGSVTLLGGEPGIGKSTLMLQALARMAAAGALVLLVTAEESKEQVRLRAERLGALHPNLMIVAETSLPHVLTHVAELAPDVLAVDSIQTVADPDVPGVPGSVSQVRECAHRLVRLAKDRNLPTLLVGHVTKDGAIAGPRTLEHIVDTVLAFEGDRHHSLRMLHALKHRFGSTHELGLFAMEEAGLADVSDPSSLFLEDRRTGLPGSVVTAVLEGARPVLVEVQALVTPARAPVPRRSSQGLDPNRLTLLLAVLDARAGLPVADADVYASVAGGIRVTEAGADLAVAIAVASARRGRPVAADLVAVGEIGLGGEVRQAAQTPRRLAEAARLGFRAAVVPTSVADVPDLELIRVGTVHEALQAAGLGDEEGVRSPEEELARAAIVTTILVPEGRTRSVAAPIPAEPGGPTPVPAAPRSEAMLSALRLVAPGRPLREGLDRIVQAKMGALVVVGDGPDVLALCSGGFLLDAEFTPQRLSELAKMDGAMILSSDCSRIARANVQLVPNPDIPTLETGTRHRTAERVAKQIDAPVITISEELALVAVHRRGLKRTLEPVVRVLSRADQALQILERYKVRLDAVSNSLSALEVEDLVTVRDVSTALQRAEMVRRIAEEIEEYVIELGADGRLILLQLEELMGGVEDDRRLFAKDYFSEATDYELHDAMGALADLDTETLLDLREVAGVLHLPHDAGLDTAVQPHGYRLLHKIPRLPDLVADHVVERFTHLQKIMRAGVPDLVEVEGVGEARARAIKDGLARLAETSILERYV